MDFPDYFDEKDFILFLKEARLAGFAIGTVVWGDGKYIHRPEEIVSCEKGWIYINEPGKQLVTYDLDTRHGKRGWWRLQRPAVRSRGLWSKDL